MFQLSQVVGTVTTPVPPSVYRLGADYYAAASLGRSFVVYEVDALSPLVFSPELPGEIGAIAGHAETTAVAYERSPRVQFFLRGAPAGECAALPAPARLLEMGRYALAYTEAGDYTVLDLEARAALYPVRRFDTLSEGERVLGACHPEGYLNKVLLATSSGRLELHNFDRNRRLAAFGPSAPGRAGACAVRCLGALAASPEQDVVAFLGLAGAAAERAGPGARASVVVFHLRAGRVLREFPASGLRPGDRFTALCFSRAEPYCYAGTALGELACLDLARGGLACGLPGAHGGAVTGLAFLPDTYLLSSGADNSLRVFGHDARLQALQRVRHRAGHVGGVSLARFYAGSSDSIVESAEPNPFLLTCGRADGALRYTQIYRRNCSEVFVPLERHGRRARALSAGARGAGGAPACAGLSANPLRDGHWANVLTFNAGEDFCHVWSFQRNSELAEPMPDKFLGRAAGQAKELRKLAKENGGLLPERAQEALRAQRWQDQYRLALPSAAVFLENTAANASERRAALQLERGDGSLNLAALSAGSVAREEVSWAEISMCGGFCVLGGSGGSLAAYALQSGRLVGYDLWRAGGAGGEGGEEEDPRVVCCFFAAGSESVLVARADGRVEQRGLDRALTVWRRWGREELRAGAGGGSARVLQAAHHFSSLLALATAERVYVYSLEPGAGPRAPGACRLSRALELRAPLAPHCLAFFCEGRRLLLAQGPELWVYDVRLAGVVHAQRMPADVASLSVSADSATLALAYVGLEGVHLYKNRERAGLPVAGGGEGGGAGGEAGARAAGPRSPGGRGGPALSTDRLRAERTLGLLGARPAGAREGLAQFGGRLRRAREPGRLPLWLELRGAGARAGEAARGPAPGPEASACSPGFLRALEGGAGPCAALLRSAPPAALALEVAGLRGAELGRWVAVLGEAGAAAWGAEEAAGGTAGEPARESAKESAGETVGESAGEAPAPAPAPLDALAAALALTLRHHQARLLALPGAPEAAARLAARLRAEHRRLRAAAELVYGFSEELREARAR